MSDLEHHIKALHEIREKKREIQDLESELRQKIIDLTGGDIDISLPDVSLNVSSKVRFKVVDSESVPSFLKSNLPDPKRIEDYYSETGSIPNGVELSKTFYVKVTSNSVTDSTEEENQFDSIPHANEANSQTVACGVTDETFNLKSFPDRDRGLHLICRKVGSYCGAIKCRCCKETTSVVEVLEFDLSLNRDEASFEYYYCGKCFSLWIQEDDQELANKYRSLTAEQLGIIPGDPRSNTDESLPQSSCNDLATIGSDHDPLENLDYTYFADGRCEDCCDADSDVRITGNYEHSRENDWTLCGKCAAAFVWSTDPELADYFYHLDHETATAEMEHAKEMEERHREYEEQQDRENEQWDREKSGRIPNDPDDPYSNYSDGSSPFSY